MALSPDINALRTQLNNLKPYLLEDKDDDNATASVELQYSANAMEKLSGYMKAVEADKKTIPPEIIKQQQKLPIFKRKDELINNIIQNQVLIIIGETGSGKTTQIPQYLREAGMGTAGRIGCTQLRRMAAKAVAKRVAKEQGCKLGEEVGYTIRFEDVTNEKTKIQYMTDGILLRECTYDRMLSSYSAIILDESHERTIDTDVLLAVLKWIIGKRNDLKLIISSATLDSKKFSSYFYNAQVFSVSGRMYPVDIKYISHSDSLVDYTDLAGIKVISINETHEKGDILVFMTGEDDIERLADYLMYDYNPSSLYCSLEVIPVYSALPWEQQALMFEPAKPGKRKVIIATNIAETSLTVDGIRYVVDSGYVKQKVHDSRKDMEILKKVRVSQAQAIQRAGRAGRVGPGICYRLYPEDIFNAFSSSIDPEIKRSNLTNAVLLLKKMGFNSMDEFDFLDEPPKEAIEYAISELELFQAIEPQTGYITEIGKKMASFPLEPNLAKMLIISEQLGCSEEIITIVALLSVPNIFFRPRKKQKQADSAKQMFYTIHGDLVMSLNVYNQWLRFINDNYWCHDNFVNQRMMVQARDIRDQLLDIMKSRNMKMISSSPNMTPVLKSICAGFFQNVAQKKIRSSFGRKNYEYLTLPKMETAFIHPGSCMHKVVPEWLVFQKLVKTSKEFLRGVTPIECSWLKEMAPAFDMKITPYKI